LAWSRSASLTHRIAAFNLFDRKKTVNETCLMVHLKRLPEGGYLATSEALQGLVAQGRTVAETLEIARDVARRLLESQKQRGRSLWINQL
jgi:predicted RNase H-like HicB family nuclease